MSLKRLTRSDNGVIFANPTDPNYTVRFKFSTGRKTIDGSRVDNNIAEIIISDLFAVNVGDKKSIVDSLSVRVRVSGSSLSHDRLKAIVQALATDLPKWATEDVLIGFEPTTVPTSV